MQRIRDEAHRYGITAHRKKRQKLGMASQLDAIPGIGPARRKALLKHFGSVDKIREASIEELQASCPGGCSKLDQGTFGMKQVWVVDDDEEMSRAVGLMLKLLDCETTSFFKVPFRSAQTLLTGKTPRPDHSGYQYARSVGPGYA